LLTLATNFALEFEVLTFSRQICHFSEVYLSWRGFKGTGSQLKLFTTLCLRPYVYTSLLNPSSRSAANCCASSFVCSDWVLMLEYLHLLWRWMMGTIFLTSDQSCRRRCWSGSLCPKLLD